MSSEATPAVRVRGLRKTYRIANTRPSTLSEALLARARAPLSRAPRNTFNALEDIDLDVASGEALAIVGHNGAGKSTLLKILSRITEPTAGRIELQGTVGALLEVGTGFHPELTGRENIYLNGSILGMRRDDVRKQFDEIVDFAGVEKFLDVPVKRYSSGMSVRLAFSVAASLSADVLIVDEVLAVGDAEFQAKCMGRMSDAANSGRTVLFVSHNLAAVQALCTRAVLLQRGRLVADGAPAAIASEYIAGLTASGDEEAPGVAVLTRLPDGKTRRHLRRVEVRESDHGGLSDHVRTGGPCVVDVLLDHAGDLALPHVGLSFWTDTGTIVATIHTQMSPAKANGPLGDSRRFRLAIDPLPLLPGNYWMDIGVRNGGDPQYLDMATRAKSLTVLPADVYGSGLLPERWEGLIYLPGAWTVS